MIVMRKKKEEKPYDPFLIQKIQPHGGISFYDEKYIKTGMGCEACIHIFQYPDEIDTHWMSNILNINDSIAIIDISTEDMIEVKRNINKSMSEQNIRYKTSKRFEDRFDAEQRYRELERLWKEIQSYGEILKSIQARIFVYGYTLREIEQKCKEVLVNLESDNYKAAIFLNEGKSEWKSLYLPYKEQQKDENSISGQSLTSETVAAGYPFHFSKLEDPYGSLLGFTSSGGSVLFDYFAKSEARLQYNAVAFGNMGRGKSTLLKKIYEDRAIRGDFIRIFDISGEFGYMTEQFGGKIYRPDGSEGIINPLEILCSGENENTNYSRHISKMGIFYRFLMPAADNYEIIEFEQVLRELYIKHGILGDDGEIGNRKITRLNSKKYPIFSDMSIYLINKIQTLQESPEGKAGDIIVRQKLQRLNNIKLTVDNVISNYGMLLDGYTSIDNMTDEQIIVFDISTLKEIKASIYDGMMFLLLSFCWDNAVENGMVMKDLWETGKIRWQEIKRFLVICDESHRWLNAQKLQAVDQVLLYCREGRKYFAGILFASQSIRDWVPEGSDALAINKIKTLFELTQYKFIFQQDANAMGLLGEIFHEQLTDSELRRIPYLTKGETILAISSDRNIEMKVHLTAEENKMFRGGA